MCWGAGTPSILRMDLLPQKSNIVPLFWGSLATLGDPFCFYHLSPYKKAIPRRTYTHGSSVKSIPLVGKRQLTIPTPTYHSDRTIIGQRPTVLPFCLWHIFLFYTIPHCPVKILNQGAGRWVFLSFLLVEKSLNVWMADSFDSFQFRQGLNAHISGPIGCPPNVEPPFNWHRPSLGWDVGRIKQDHLLKARSWIDLNICYAPFLLNAHSNTQFYGHLILNLLVTGQLSGCLV